MSRVLLTITKIHAYVDDGSPRISGVVQKEGFEDREVSIPAKEKWISLGYLDQVYLDEIGAELERKYNGVSDLWRYAVSVGDSGK